jgi:hypothetical protein
MPCDIFLLYYVYVNVVWMGLKEQFMAEPGGQCEGDHAE